MRLFTLFAFLSLALSLYAKPMTGLDEPGEGEPLRQYFWTQSKGTNYQAALTYTKKAQAESQVTLSHTATLPTGWKLGPDGPRFI